jgi:RHS repeat-associated protein
VRKTVLLGNGDAYTVLPRLLPDGKVEAGSPGADEIYVFDAQGRHLQSKSALTGAVIYSFNYSPLTDALVSIVDAYQNTTTFERVGSRLSAVISPFGQRTMIEVDANEYISAVQTPDGGRFEMTYHGDSGLMSTFKKPGGQVSTFTYDNKGRLSRDEGSGGNAWDLLRTVQPSGSIGIRLTSGEGLRTDYDIVQGLAQISGAFVPFTQRVETLPSGARSTMIHTPLSSMRKTTKESMDILASFTPDPRFGNAASYISARTTRSPTGRRQVTQITKTAVGGDPLDPYNVIQTRTEVQVNNQTTIVQFDAASKRHLITTPVGRQASVDIDEHERPIRLQTADLTPVTYLYDLRGRLSTAQQGPRTTGFSYDAQGFVQRVTNSLGQATEFTHDANGRVLSQRLADQRVIQFAYDANGNLTSVTPSGRTAHGFFYNAFDLISTYLPPSLDSAPAATTYEYDRDKRITRINRPDGQSLVFNYNLTKGLLNSITTPSGSHQFQYHASELPFEILSPQGVRTQFFFDGTLLMDQSNSGEGRGRIRYGYDDFFRISSMEVDGGVGPIPFHYDLDGLLVQAGAETLLPNAASGLLENTTLDGITESYAHSGFSETSQYTASRNGAALFAATYVRDNLGRITSRTETIGLDAMKTYAYTYDSVGRLVSVSLNGGITATYAYDANNNRLNVNRSGATSFATYDAQDRLLTYRVPESGTVTPTPTPASTPAPAPSPRNTVSIILQGVIAKISPKLPQVAQVLTKIVDEILKPPTPTLVTWNYGYNLNGEMTSKVNTASNETTSYAYDVFGNLTSVTLPNGSVIGYIIDGQNRRVAQLVNGVVIRRYLYRSQLQIAAELDPTGQVVSQFVYGSKGNIPDYMVKAGIRYKFIADHLGSPRLIVDTNSGVITQQMEFDEFGRVLQDTNPGFQPYGFAGGLYDPDTKLVRFGARDYDPEVGRWTSKDPIGFAGGDSNLYGYVMNDPVNLVDLSGLKWGSVSPVARPWINEIGRGSPAGRQLISDIGKLPYSVNVNIDPTKGLGDSSYDPANNTATIGTKAGQVCVAGADGNPFPMSPSRALGHELGHARAGGNEFDAIRTENGVSTPIDGNRRCSLGPINCQ